jgi:hypothetical protein
VAGKQMSNMAMTELLRRMGRRDITVLRMGATKLFR